MPKIIDAYPMTALQKGMFFYNSFFPESAAYTVQTSYEISDLNIGFFQRSLQYVIDRTPVLRSIFLQKNGEFLQCILDAWDTLPLKIFNEDSYISSEVQYCLDRGPLFFVSIISLQSGSYKIVFNFHHIILDGWSQSLLLQRIFDTYNSLINGEALPIFQEISFKDYILWLYNQDYTRAIQVWKNYFSSFDSDDLLIFQEEEKQGRYYEEFLDLSKIEINLIKGFSRKERLTLSTIFLGVIGHVLMRYFNKLELVIGVITSGRHHLLEGIDSVIGMMINSIPIALKMEFSNVINYLNQLQSDIHSLSQYDYVSLTDINHLIGKKKLFDILFAYENFPRNSGGCFFNREEKIEQTEYPLNFIVLDSEDSLRIRCVYDESFFAKEEVCNILTYIKKSLSHITRTTSYPPVLIPQSYEDMDQFVVEGTVLDLINKNVIQYPDSIAITVGNRHLTYSELNKVSNKIANFLRSKGVYTGDLVGIYANHSIESITGILGILKSGCGYMPINPEYPEARINYMLTESKVKLVIDMRQLKTEGLSAEYNHLEISNSCLAYVIYTSGSTGKPKGVVVTHKGLINCIKETIIEFGVKRNDRILQFASMNFDVSVWETFVAFCSGASLVLCPDCKNLLNFQNYSATVVIMTPSVLKINNYVPSLVRILISGSETLDKSAMDKFINVPYRFNAYGPTENSIISSILHFDIGEINENSIGNAINNTQIYILNHTLEQLPSGVIGEICIGGVGLARGYLNQPALTAEKFIANPFGNGDRLYRTGDLGRYLSDGNIEFLGRIDNQVKIRGFRIELGEIESVINDCDQVKASVALAKDGQLVAYIVPNNINELEESYKFKTQQGEEIAIFAGEKTAELVESVRTKISQKLPEYMVPSYFVVLEKIPLNPNDKTDSKLLQTLETGKRLLIDEYVAPRTEVERELCEVWQEVLHLDKVGINDNFFKIGGDSILAIQVVSRAKKQNITLSVKDIFLHKTLSNLSSIVVQNRDFTEDFEYETAAFGLLDQSVKSDVLKVLEERACKQK